MVHLFHQCTDLIVCYLVQEFLALPRADAIRLLMQNNGNAEAVIQQLFP